jgi:hypothetical protein
MHFETLPLSVSWIDSSYSQCDNRLKMPVLKNQMTKLFSKSTHITLCCPRNSVIIIKSNVLQIFSNKYGLFIPDTPDDPSGRSWAKEVNSSSHHLSVYTRGASSPKTRMIKYRSTILQSGSKIFGILRKK